MNLLVLEVASEEIRKGVVVCFSHFGILFRGFETRETNIPILIVWGKSKTYQSELT